MVSIPGDRLNAVKLVSGWLSLTLLLNMRYPAPLAHPLAILLPPPELILITGAIAAAAWKQITIRRPVFVGLTILLCLVWVFHLGESIVRAYLNRGLALYTDLSFIPDLVNLLYTTVSRTLFLLGISGSILFAAALFSVIYLSLRLIYAALGSTRTRRLFCRVGAGLMAVYLVVLPITAPQNPLRSNLQSTFVRMVQEIWFTANIDKHRKAFLNRLDQPNATLPRFAGSLDRLQGNDVHLIYIESYGHTVFAHQRHRQLMQPVLTWFEGRLTSGGFTIYSNFLNSPTYGGASWLAHTTVTSGYHLNKQFKYNLMVTSDLKTAAHAFQAAGYRTVSIMPGITWPYPEADFFGFEKDYHERQFDYRGPKFGWSPMPDQYVLEFIYHREMALKQQPLFIEWVLTNSHVPFHQQPPYLEDWSEIGDGSIYLQKDKITFPVTWPELKNADEAYTSALTYEFKILADFFEHRIKDDALILIMGDHQPNLKITGPDQPWSVPVHVLSRNPEFLKPFAARGYTPGMVPAQPSPHIDMASVMQALFDDFGTPVIPYENSGNNPESK